MQFPAVDNKSIPIRTNTENEIWGQPALWLKLWDNFKKEEAGIRFFLKKVLSGNDVRIILTGAGTSSFIGDVLLGTFNENFNVPVYTTATTDLVTHPELFFNKNNKYLLISFARSGNSPESSQAILLAEKFSKKVYHLIITCSSNSELLKIVSGKDHFIFLMPPDADDKGLAMTGSFTSMLLAGLLISNDKETNPEDLINAVYSYGNKILEEYSGSLKEIAGKNFSRAVFLGSGMLKGVARESQLKLQELTDGKVICKYDSFLGFRHGPKAVLNENTLIVYLFSNSSYANKYEADLVKGINEGRKTLCSVGLMEEEINISQLDLKIILSGNGRKLSDGFLSIVSVLPAQLLGFYKSLHLGLNPDSPSDSGMIHRVVQGVKIYPYE